MQHPPLILVAPAARRPASPPCAQLGQRRRPRATRWLLAGAFLAVVAFDAWVAQLPAAELDVPVHSVLPALFEVVSFPVWIAAGA